MTLYLWGWGGAVVFYGDRCVFGEWVQYSPRASPGHIYPIPDGVLGGGEEWGTFPLKQFYNLKKRVLGKIFSNKHGSPLVTVGLKFFKEAISYSHNNYATVTLFSILLWQSLLQSIGFRPEENTWWGFCL